MRESAKYLAFDQYIYPVSKTIAMSIFTDIETASKPLVDTELELFGLELDEFSYCDDDQSIFSFDRSRVGHLDRDDKFFSEYSDLTAGVTMNDFVSAEYWKRVLMGVADICDAMIPANSWDCMVLSDAISNLRDAGNGNIPIDQHAWIASIGNRTYLKSSCKTHKFTVNIYYTASLDMKPLIKSALLRAKHI